MRIKVRFFGSRTVHGAIMTGDVGFMMYGVLTDCGTMRNTGSAWQPMADSEPVTCKRCKRKVV